MDGVLKNAHDISIFVKKRGVGRFNIVLVAGKICVGARSVFVDSIGPVELIQLCLL